MVDDWNIPQLRMLNFAPLHSRGNDMRGLVLGHRAFELPA
jgi:hypothetical protein